MRRDYEPDVSQILALYQQLEDDILASMTKRMLKMGYVSESTKYQAEILQSAGLLREDVAQMIAQRTDASVQQVKALFEDAGVETVRIDNEIYREAGVLPIDIRQDEGMRNLLEEGYRRTLGTMQNLVGTTAAQTEQQFISACDRAYMQVSSGAFSYQEAIMTAVKSFADIGAEVVYPSGHRDKLDVAVRRAVLTGVGQATAAVSLKHADEAGCDLMELSAHSGARPDHAEWQGQLVSRTGKNAGRTIDGLHVYSLDQIGYGTGRGFKGWNCRHNWYPYYEGFSKPNYTKQQIAALNAKNIPYNGQMYSEYEISQMQRAAERKIRKLKRRLITTQESIRNAPDDATRAAAQNYYNRNAVKLKDAEKQLRDFCNQTGQWNDKFRTQVSGFGQSEAQKAVWANRKDKMFSGGSGNLSKFFGKEFQELLDKAEKSAKIKLGEVSKYGQEHSERIQGYLADAPEQVRNVWNRCASRLYNLGKHPKGHTGYTSRLDGVYLDIERASRGSDILAPYESVFHEYGHQIDYILNRMYGNGDKHTAFSEVYKDGALGKKVKEEVQKALSDFEQELISSGKYTSDTLPSRQETEKLFCKKIIDEFTGESGALNKRPIANISDMFEAGMEFTESPFEAGHKTIDPDYWKGRNNGKEAFAEMFSATVNHPESLKQIKRFFPESYQIFLEMLGVVKDDESGTSETS